MAIIFVFSMIIFKKKIFSESALFLNDCPRGFQHVVVGGGQDFCSWLGVESGQVLS